MPGLTEPNQNLKREDLADLLSIVDLKATPFLTRARKLKAANNTLFEWGVDAYASPNTTPILDGTDVGEYENHAENRGRLKNNIQINRRTAKVSRLAEEVSEVAGVSSEIGFATTKKLKELGRDIETTCLMDQDAQAESGGAMYKTCALGTWISVAGPTTYSVPAAFRTPTAQVNTTATASLVEDTDIQGMLQSIYDSTGMNGEFVLFAGSTLRRRFTDMVRTVANATSTATKVRTFNSDINSETVKNTVSVYEGDFGSIEIVPSNFIGWASGAPEKGRGYVLDMTKIGLVWNKASRAERLVDQGGGPRVLIEAVWGLRVENPLGLGKFDPA